MSYANKRDRLPVSERSGDDTLRHADRWLADYESHDAQADTARGARIVNATRFRDAVEGITRGDLADAYLAEIDAQNRIELRVCAWVLGFIAAAALVAALSYFARFT